MLRRLRAFFILFCTSVLFIACNAHAQLLVKDPENSYQFNNQKINVKARLQTGYLTGTANEIVYAGSNSGSLVSKLNWDIDDIYMVGVGASVQQKWLALHIDYWTKADTGEGTMDDYDWVVSGADWSDWSHHDNTELTVANSFDINTELIVPRLSSKKFVLSGYLGYKYEEYKWQSLGGSYIYSNGGWRNDIGSFPSSQLVISYEQAYQVPYLGVGVRGAFGKFELAGRLIGSPWVKLTAKDRHILRGLGTVASLEDGEMISYDLLAAYNFSETMALELGYSYSKYDSLRGDSIYSYSGGPTFMYLNGEGADLETSMLKIVFNYSF